uniref:Uncharacterized protein n=1 Tax=Oryza punctata TaxID=4537 RepID=A0A0E0MF37_ORYPU
MAFLLPLIVICFVSGTAAAADAPLTRTHVANLPGFGGALPSRLETGYVHLVRPKFSGLCSASLGERGRADATCYNFARYVTVDEVNGAELFYYFIESEGDPGSDPVLLWLTGGDRCSVLSAIFFEIGQQRTICPSPSSSSAISHTVLPIYQSASSCKLPAGPVKLVIEPYNGGLPRLRYHPYSWTKVASILFVDSPVGAGFSFSQDPNGYDVSEVSSSLQIVKFLYRWFDGHPEYRANPFYVGGDSIAGRFVPFVTQKISEDIEAAVRPSLNLKGYLVGNPVTGESIDNKSKVPYFHGVGIISDQLYKVIMEHCKGEDYDKPKNLICRQAMARFNETPPCADSFLQWLVVAAVTGQRHLRCKRGGIGGVTPPADEVVARMMTTNLAVVPAWRMAAPAEVAAATMMTILLDEVSKSHILYKKCIYLSPRSNLKSVHRKILKEKFRVLEHPPPRPSIQCLTYANYLSYFWANNNITQETLGIKKGSVNEWVRCHNNDLPYTEDITSSIKYHRNVTLKGYRALVYSGDHDSVVPFLGTQTWVRSLGYPIVDDWRAWHVDGQSAGFTIAYENNLTFATIKDGGHTAPEYQPERCLAMFKRWISNMPL